MPTEATWRRKRYSAFDVLVVALATAVMLKHWEGTPLRDPPMRGGVLTLMPFRLDTQFITYCDPTSKCMSKTMGTVKSGR